MSSTADTSKNAKIADAMQIVREYITGTEFTPDSYQDILDILDGMEPGKHFKQPIRPLEQGMKYDWISVADGLPPPAKNVAILVEDTDAYILGWATAGYYHSAESGWWHGTPGDYRSCRDQRWTVTHWIDLPAIPERDSCL